MFMLLQIPARLLSISRPVGRKLPKPDQTVQPSPQSMMIDVNVDNSSDAIPPPPLTVEVEAGTSSDKFYRFLPASSVLLLIFMFVVSTYNARGQPRDISFVLLCYTILLSLLYCLRKYERLESDASPLLMRRSLKAVILLLTTGLNVAFACRASELVPWPFAAVIWASAAFVALIGYFALFVWSNRVANGALPHSKLDSNSNSKNNNNCKEEEKCFFHNELSPEDKA